MTFHLWPPTLLPYDLHHLSEKRRGKEREEGGERDGWVMKRENVREMKRFRLARDTTAEHVKTEMWVGWRWDESQQWMTVCRYCNHMFGVWWLGNQLVWPSCRCCHVSLITNGMTGNINYPNLFVITTATHTLIGKSLVLNCMSHLITARRNRLSLSLWKSDILIKKASSVCYLSKGNLEQVNESEQINVSHYSC